MSKRNIVLLLILTILFTIDYIKFKFFKDEIKISQTEQSENQSQDLSELKPEDLKLDDEKNEVENVEKSNNKNKTVKSENLVELHFLVCKSFSSNVDEIKKGLLSRFSNLEIFIKNDEPEFYRKILSYILTFLQFCLIAISLGGDSIKPYITKIIPENIFNFINEKKMMFSMISWFGFSYISSFIVKTNTFSLYADSQYTELIFSSKGKVPTLDNLINSLIDNGLELIE